MHAFSHIQSPKSRPVYIRFILLIFILWGTGGCVETQDPAFLRETAGDLHILFTSPRYPDDWAYHVGGLDETLAAAIDDAEQSVDVAAFDFDLARVAEALIAAHEDGVHVRMVIDSDNADLEEVEALKRARIPIVEDERDALMHNKFVIIDGYEIWTGSWNLTDNGTYRNDNNVVVIHSRRLAENYIAEFEEMFEDRAFGPSSPADTPHPHVKVNGVPIENYFEPEENVRIRILDLLNEAESSIMVMAFTLTDDDIAQALVRKGREGILVEGVIESRNTGARGSDFEALQKAGEDVNCPIEFLKDGNPYMMHHKVIIVDEEVVITGSYNFTASAADRNDENLLIIHSSEIAQIYGEAFKKVFQQAKEGQ
jgi:phosphatidylserine/phosphatidylglycerophosphate/cardiolipin synthase-like enzyme